jgi:aerobic carbon-monoxide dehydrogenase medium subunit
MKPVDFKYSRPAALAEALAEMTENSNAKPLAGGQSLGPMLNMRIVRPGKLIDISRLPELRTRSDTADSAMIGACVTHAEIEDDETLDPTRGFLTDVAGRIAYRAVRNKGTIGGAVAHADPAADWLCALTAAGATLIAARAHAKAAPGQRRFPWLRSPSNALGVYVTRRIDICAFVLGAFTTTLGPNELLIGVDVPKVSPAVRWGYVKFCRKVGELADAIGAVIIDPQRRFARVVAGAVGGAPLLLEAAARELAASAAAPSLDEVQREIGAALPRLDPVKRQQLAVSVERAITQALG